MSLNLGTMPLKLLPISTKYREIRQSGKTVQSWFQKFHRKDESFEDQEDRDHACIFYNEQFQSLAKQNSRHMSDKCFRYLVSALKY